jgi:histidine triad (HIT) family protein
MSEDCIFCKIIRGEFGTEFVYETANTVVFNDINPKAPVHMLVCPKKHIPTLNDLEDKELMAELLQTVKDVTKEVGLKSYRVQINTGKEAGQEVFHLHLHILGRK